MVSEIARVSGTQWPTQNRQPEKQEKKTFSEILDREIKKERGKAR